MRLVFLVALVFSTGCNLYFTDGGDDDCLAVPEVADTERRDPFTGECVSVGYPCDDFCGPCPALTIAEPDWAFCFNACGGHADEQSCAADPQCRVIYDSNAPTDEPPTFRECWGIAPSGPAAPGGCENLDAYECSRHNDCAAVYDSLGDDANGLPLQFAKCVPEPVVEGCYADEECGPNSHCTTSDGECLAPPGCTDDVSCPAVCYGRCVPNGGSCASVDCAPGSHCEEHCTVDPNGVVVCDVSCVPDQMSCGPDACPPGTECVQTCTDQDPNNPGCGVCTVECVPLGTCEGLADEAACTGRSDCRAVYEGENCTCYQDGTCECEILTYDHCETK